VVLLFVAVVAAGLTWLLTNIFQHKEEARNPFTKVVELDDSTYDPAVWGKNFPIQDEQYKKSAMSKKYFEGATVDLGAIEACIPDAVKDRQTELIWDDRFYCITFCKP